MAPHGCRRRILGIAVAGAIANNRPLELGKDVAMAIRLGLVGLGKIARDQHLPAIAGNPAFTLVAVADSQATLADTANYSSLAALLADGPVVDAIALCTPPQGRRQLAELALAAGKHVLLEKPPTAGINEIDALHASVRQGGPVLYTAWHSQAAAAVAPAAQWLAGKQLRSIDICWREDVRRWHPGQRWIWAPGGLGVFDPGINALSILTTLVTAPIFVESAQLWVPENCHTPIRAALTMVSAEGTPINCQLDWDPSEETCWDIALETEQGTALLREGGARLLIDGVEQALPPEREYASLYAQFAELIGRGQSRVDSRPLRLVADACLLGRAHRTAAFHE
jgi:predicted dehydrogenase